MTDLGEEGTYEARETKLPYHHLRVDQMQIGMDKIQIRYVLYLNFVSLISQETTMVSFSWKQIQMSSV